ncbi:MAG: nitronate monooxygenase [Dehalococcoidia bacterium]
MRTRICDQLGIEFPIFAFSHCRDVVAAVSRAGGLGVLGALVFPPEQLEIELKWIDEHVDGKPYGVDVVIPASYEGADRNSLEKMIPEEHKKFVDGIMKKFNIPELAQGEEQMHGLLGWSREKATPQVEVALSHPIKLLANALGAPPKEIVDRAHAQNVSVAALVGTPHQAKYQVDAGVDIVVASGTEAGGHTGEISTMVLIPQVVEAVHPTPVLAAGGIGSGRQAAAALALGADGVWTGSIWLAVKESDTSEVVQEKLFNATSRDTVRSRAMTGKRARLLKTPWTDAWESEESPGALPMPLQFMLTAEAFTRINKYAAAGDQGAKELAFTPVGQIVGSMKNRLSCRDMIFQMVDEYIAAVGSLDETLAVEEPAR